MSDFEGYLIIFGSVGVVMLLLLLIDAVINRDKP